jgi:hypothetical protein
MIDPDLFRTTHYGARRYRDQQPADHIAQPSDTKLINVTTIAKAIDTPGFYKRTPGGTRVPLDALRVADAAIDGWTALQDMETAERHEVLATSAGRDLARAGERGIDCHLYLEGLLRGEQPVMLNADSIPYIPTLTAIAEEFSPLISDLECVMFARGDRHLFEYAGTADAFCITEPGGTIIDWKTRAATSSHGCYITEVAQLGLLANCDYMFTENPEGEPVRYPLPEIDRLLIVSIKPDSYQVYEIDPDIARQAAIAAMAVRNITVDIQQKAKTGIGAPRVVETVAADPHQVRLDWFTSRYQTLAAAGHRDTILNLWEDIPAPKHRDEWTPEQLDTALNILNVAEARHQMPFPGVDPATPIPPARPTAAPVKRTEKITAPTPDNGPEVDPAQVLFLQEQFASLYDHQKQQIMDWRTEGKQAGADWHLGSGPVHERIYWIAAAAIYLAVTHSPDDREAIIELVIGKPALTGTPLGHTLGTLTVGEAQHIAEFAQIGLPQARKQVAQALIS